MNKLVDSESLGKFKELMDEKLKNKVSKKKKSQVIIGRAIKPGALDIGGMENWYAFAGEPTIFPWGSGLKDVYTKDVVDDKYFSQEYRNITNGYRIVSAHENYMWRVDRYEIDENNYLSIWLSYKQNSCVQKGTSTRLEINNGRKYDTRKILPKDIFSTLVDIYNWTGITGESRVEKQKVILKRFGQRYKNSRIRNMVNIRSEEQKKLKWGKLYFRIGEDRKKPRRLRHISGKYKIRFMNKRNAYSPPVTFYFRRSIVSGNFNIEQIIIE